MTEKELFLRAFPASLRKLLETAVENFACLQEIRLRVGQPVFLTYGNREWYLGQDGKRCRDGTGCVRMTQELLREMLSFLSNYSVYAVEQELRQGFLTMPGGHRVGICGKLVLENGQAKTLREVSSMNLRVAHSHPGCADAVLRRLPILTHPGNVLLVSPPGCGKTTLLRDFIRQLSVGGYTVGVVDERSEIAACYQGIPGQDLGPRTDVLDATPKAIGMRMLLRSMAPDYIAVDEIGGGDEIRELWTAMHCGCHLIATCHAADRAELFRKPELSECLKKHCFQGIVFLSRSKGVGTIEEVEWNVT